MTKAQWKAVYDYCEVCGITKWDILKTLKQNGAIDRRDTLDDLGDYVAGETYAEMMKFLEENV